VESILPSNTQHIERAVEAVLHMQKKKVGVLGLSFKAGTDDLRESPLVHLVKRLLGEGCQIRIWDEFVALGRLIGSNRQFIEDEIPHIGNLFSSNLKETVETAEVVILGTNTYPKQELQDLLRPHQIVFDLVGLEKAKRLSSAGSYSGICW
jgi:GDP-mannose 6-dehydrogenase